ncbi:MAG: serine/threonine-protein kinase [Planctomycetota bacterium]|jgi:serine/threonine protein kinase
MTDWIQIREVFEAAVELVGPDRANMLDQACAGQPELRRRVEDLLNADDITAAALIDGKAAVEHLEEANTRLKRVGAYDIVRVLGAGGMGTVFEATQQSPKRSVAIKILRSFLVTDSARRRFEYEVETLARLQHPNIAQIYEAGTWQDPNSGEDSPFFAMEFVPEAKSLDAYSREADLDLSARLELFLQVCDAVQHGHLQGVLHRDLKPGNILVDAEGRPKVIDFGIARVEEGADEGRSMMTMSGQVLGTLAYMSPEQLDGSSTQLDLRSDVYSLGATLYEILCGRPPHERGSDTLPGFVARVSATNPRPPSTSSPELSIPEELDWILLKALEGERERRYASVSEFAADLRRLLQNEPVLARPQTAGYILQKFVRRHRSLVTTIAAALILLLGTTVVAVTGWVEADQATQTAQLEADTQAAVTNYMLGLIERARAENGGQEILMGDVLAQSEAVIEDLAKGRVDVAAQMRLATANSYLSLRQPEKAMPILVGILESSQDELGPTHSVILSARHSLGMTLSNIGKLAEAIECLNQVLEQRLILDGPDSETVAETRQVLGSTLLEAGELEAAERELRAASRYFRAQLNALSRADEVNPKLSRKVVQTDTALAMALYTGGKNEAAENIARPAWELARSDLGEDDPATALAGGVLANILAMLGNFDQAVEHAERLLEFNRRRFGADSPSTLASQSKLGAVLLQAGRTSEALEQMRAAWAGTVRNGDRSMDALISLYNLAGTLERHGELEESLRSFDEVFIRCEGLLPETHWLYGQIRKGYGTLLRRLQRYEEAELESLAALELMEAQLGPDHQRVQKVLEELVTLYQAWDRPDEAARYAARLAGG